MKWVPCSVFKLLMVKWYHIYVEIKGEPIDSMVWITILLILGIYEIVIQPWLILLMSKKPIYVSLYFCYRGLFSVQHGVCGIWILEMAFILWHCITLHCMAFGVMSRTYGCDRTGTASFIGYNDAASYLVGCEGRSLCAYAYSIV